MRSGAIVPLMHVDDQTMNITGMRKDGSRRDELILRVAASAEPTTFILYEDDGVSIAYQDGMVRSTEITQQQQGSSITVHVAPAQGTYEGALVERDTHLQVVTRDGNAPNRVKLNGQVLDQAGTEAEFDAMKSGWYFAAPNLVLVKTGVIGVAIPKTIEIRY
jgi:alpha-glucosidase